MTGIETLMDEIRRSFFGEAWHGPALLEALGSLSAAEAAARPLPAAHSAWEIALHTLAWTEELTRRLSGQKPGLPARGDWPDVPEPDEQAWADLRAQIESAHRELARELAAFPEERLAERIGSREADTPIAAVTYGFMLHGLAQHNAYHAGQIMLLGRALEGGAVQLEHDDG